MKLVLLELYFGKNKITQMEIGHENYDQNKLGYLRPSPGTWFGSWLDQELGRVFQLSPYPFLPRQDRVTKSLGRLGYQD